MRESENQDAQLLITGPSRNGPPPSPPLRVESRLRKDGMPLLKVGRFYINLAYIQFIHEEREDFILHFSEGSNIRTTSIARNSPDGELLQRFLISQLWVEPASAS
ncbi:MAG: hypothetical protein R3B37_03895 [Nitrospira sp.]|nr:hypothetical protein [Nitrospira sp.]